MGVVAVVLCLCLWVPGLIASDLIRLWMGWAQEDLLAVRPDQPHRQRPRGPASLPIVRNFLLASFHTSFNIPFGAACAPFSLNLCVCGCAMRVILLCSLGLGFMDDGIMRALKMYGLDFNCLLNVVRPCISSIRVHN
jgi:hypothetical protein